MRSTFTRIVTLLLVAVVLVACGEPAGQEAATSVTSMMVASSNSTTATVPATTSSTTTVPPAPSTSMSATVITTTTSTTSSTTTVPPTSTTEDVYYSFATHGGRWVPSLPGSSGWYGSGCSPGPGPLPDGIWFGFVRDATPAVITFDLACLDFDDDPPAEGDWVLRNDNPKLRAVPVTDSAQVISGRCWSYGNCPEVLPYLDWIELLIESYERGREDLVFWLYVNDGTVTEVMEPALAG